MFHTISQPILEQMRRLEEADAKDRTDGTDRLKRLRQIPPETGKFLALLAASAPSGKFIEIGTSGGYSTLWLSLACRAANRRLTTFELLPEKAKLAAETFTLAGVTDIVTLITGDARLHLPRLTDIAFCFLDAEKEVYADCYEMVVPNLITGSFLIADNVLSHKTDLQPVVERAQNDSRLDAVVVPIGKGLLMCRKI